MPEQTKASPENIRLKDPSWKKWGPYVSDRQWGTVREDYSANGDAWNHTTHDMARSKTYRWGEEGIGGICDSEQLLCFAPAFWNKKDPIIKERFFGLTNGEGNHGEDVKELYYYLKNTPAHSYMKMLYKYPISEFPYARLVQENAARGRRQPEFELMDTGVFNNGEYYDIVIEYAKNGPEDILIKLTVFNRSAREGAINLLPTIWFRNTWAWGYDGYKPLLKAEGGAVRISHKLLGEWSLIADHQAELLFCENDTNTRRLYNYGAEGPSFKDGINDYLLKQTASLNPDKTGTKAAFNFDITVPANGHHTIRLRLTSGQDHAFGQFDDIFRLREQEAEDFYHNLGAGRQTEAGSITQQALSGMLWNKQFYYFDIHQWLNGDPAQPAPPMARLQGRNSKWKHMNTKEIISMPDKWEYPWFASWDTAFHCLALAKVDMAFAKNQLSLFIRDWYIHPNGQLPAYEWDFGDANPPVHAMVTWKLYQLEKIANNGKGDIFFLERIFNKLVINFTWWVNRKDSSGNNIFEGGFLGLDNIGVFDRNTRLPDGQKLEQADGTSWMAAYSLHMLRIATELAARDKAYEDIASKFFEHFIYIAAAMSDHGGKNDGLWDDADGFYYDQVRLPDNYVEKMRVRSVVGLIPLFATEILSSEAINNNPIFRDRLAWFSENRPDLATLVSRWNETKSSGKHLISLLRGYRMKALLRYMLDENEFLSGFGIRSLSKYHSAHPYYLQINGMRFCIRYTPAESDSGLFGGNSNWRGPVWLPVNYLIIDALNRFYEYYGDGFLIECPTNSGNMMNLKEVGDEICRRLSRLFLKDKQGRRPIYGTDNQLQYGPDFDELILFYEYFDGDTGKGLGASHQTGWTGLIANCLGHHII